MPRNEEQLRGGNATDAVMRVGNTVRKPWQENTPAVHRFMEHLRDQGLSEAPQTYGKDPQGRHVVEFVAGTPAPHDRSLLADLLSTVGRSIRSIHDCAAGFTPAPGEPCSSLVPVADAEMICHNDLAPWSLVLGDEPVFIDCDGAGPSTRL
ncbi:phosphotransferase [Paeniglutamicibacter gangotriensis]|uniref:Phosphotransferase n=1 Tax=Paeniglutamicibacter gangotriensis TaxID=254787 RepID=A0A5B0EJ04_9MICC|nr:phosphotransferase [Paeniglutamicibacter gangotriensis]KAA0979027.1 phosphotransferase [Paeniglutamicibacter gangotriensis]